MQANEAATVQYIMPRIHLHEVQMKFSKIMDQKRDLNGAVNQEYTCAV